MDFTIVSFKNRRYNLSLNDQLNTLQIDITKPCLEKRLQQVRQTTIILLNTY